MCTQVKYLQMCQLIYKPIFTTTLQMYYFLNKYLLSTIYVLCWTHSNKWKRYDLFSYGGSRLIVSVVPWSNIQSQQICTIALTFKIRQLRLRGVLIFSWCNTAIECRYQRWDLNSFFWGGALESSSFHS